MYLDSSPVTARRSDTPRRRGACRKPVRLTRRSDASAARRSRVDDAIVAQWLLDQLPTEHRHTFSSATPR